MITGKEAIDILTYNPLLSNGAVSFKLYKARKDIKKEQSKHVFMYECGEWEVLSTSNDGTITIRNSRGIECKVMVYCGGIKYNDCFNVGDKFKAKLNRMKFFKYWDFESCSSYDCIKNRAK